MNANILALPQPWIAGASHQVTVDVAGAPAGTSVMIALHRSLPKPDQHLGSKNATVTGAGNASATFTVTFTSPGINVLHCEVTSATDFDSDSAGTIVT